MVTEEAFVGRYNNQKEVAVDGDSSEEETFKPEVTYASHLFLYRPYIKASVTRTTFMGLRERWLRRKKAGGKWSKQSGDEAEI